MPIFDYTCAHCEHEFERMVKKYDDEVECPECGEIANKEVSAPAAMILKGLGIAGKSFVHRLSGNKRLVDPFLGYDHKVKKTNEFNEKRAKSHKEASKKRLG